MKATVESVLFTLIKSLGIVSSKTSSSPCLPEANLWRAAEGRPPWARARPAQARGPTGPTVYIFYIKYYINVYIVYIIIIIYIYIYIYPVRCRAYSATGLSLLDLHLQRGILAFFVGRPYAGTKKACPEAPPKKRQVCLFAYCRQWNSLPKVYPK